MTNIQSGIRDNRHRGCVAEFLQAHIKPDAELSFVSAYFTISAFAALQKELESIGSMRFLFGEPSFLDSIDPDRTDRRAFSLTHDGLGLREQLQQKAAARDCAHWIEEKVEVRSVVRPDFLHGKLYHIAHQNVEDAILGSSNFTFRGLGLDTKNANLELNLVVNDRRDLDDLKVWFDEVWIDKKNVAPVKDEVLRYLEKLYAENAPRRLYFKTLLHLFEGAWGAQSDAELFGDVRGFAQTKTWQALYDFQRDGVRSAVNKIKTHNGCIIADSVGLGKTFEALAVIKYFELKGQNVLVLCPKRLRENWTLYVQNSNLNPFCDDRFGYTVLSHTDLSRESGTVGIEDLSRFNWGKFGLVVIDESHNFRNNARGHKRDDGTFVPSRYERLMNEVIKQGARTQVLLLSATPVNVDLKDLRNQIYLMTGDQDDAFRDSIGVVSVKDLLAQAQRGFFDWANNSSTRRNPEALYDKLKGGFFTLLDALTIARSRRHIERHYAAQLDVIGHFPKRLAPISLSPDIDTRGLFLPYDKLDEEISEYKLAIFRPSQYVKDEHSNRYQDTTGVANFSQEARERYLIGMMKVNFLKRLESSVCAFRISMKRTIDKIETLENKIADFKRLEKTNLELRFEAEIEGEENDEAESLDDLTVGKGVEYSLRHLRLDDWLQDLQADKQKLHSLWLQAENVTSERGAKLRDLKNLLREHIESAKPDRDGVPNRKVLVFTAFADTADYLYENLHSWAHDEFGVHVAKVSGGTGGNRATTGRSDFNEILTNFSPRSKKRASNGAEIDLLIATDCISEGQNLQDCGFLVNYDIHWNPVRLIQRFGRIDRIGSRHESIQMVNFWPVDDLNKYINLKNRVESRMALADISATTEDNILGHNSSSENARELVEDDLRFRDVQLLKMRDEVLDLEELDGVTLGDFSLEEFRLELLDFLDEDAEALRREPLGMYANVAATEKIGDGVVFCLCAKTPAPDAKPSHLNPTAPFYLLYVAKNGEVKLGFAQARQVLSMLRELCAKHHAPDNVLCEAFALATSDGLEMGVVNELIKSAVAACGEQLQNKTLSGLTQRGATLLDGGAQKQIEYFQLVTWFVIGDVFDL